jgi:hypothetical protein
MRPNWIRNARLALRVGRGCAELHDRLMVGIRVNRLELDEAWSKELGKIIKILMLRQELRSEADEEAEERPQ